MSLFGNGVEQHALMIARIFGPLMVVVGVWFFLRPAMVTKFWHSMKDCGGSCYLFGIINCLLGMIILTFCNSWTWPLPLLVTLLGYSHLLRGVLVLFFPEMIAKRMLANPKALSMLGLIPMVWGLALSWFSMF